MWYRKWTFFATDRLILYYLDRERAFKFAVKLEHVDLKKFFWNLKKFSSIFVQYLIGTRVLPQGERLNNYHTATTTVLSEENSFLWKSKGMCLRLGREYSFAFFL